MRRKFLSVVLCVCMMLTMAPFAFAEEGISASDGGSSVGNENVAKINNTEYATLQNAVNAAQENDTILVLSDTDITATGLDIPSNKVVTLDLNGHEVKAANTNKGNIKVQGKLILKDSTDTNKTGEGQGKITTSSIYAYGTVDKVLVCALNGEFVMESGLIDAATNITDNTNNGQFAVGVQNESQNASVTINGGKIKAGWYAIAGNGSCATYNGDITVNGGILESTADYAIYHPQAGTTTINGGVIYGQSGGIAINRGTLVVNDGMITSKGIGSTGSWGDGTGNLNNAAIHANAKYGDVSVSIKNGKVIAEGNAVTIDQGTGHNATVAISGGTFSSDVSQYCEKNYYTEKNDDNTYSVKSTKDVAVAQIGDTYYNTLADAVADASTTNPDTIELLKDTTERLILNGGKEITLDLGGNTLSYTEQTVRVNHGKLTVNGPGAIKEINPNLGAILIKGSTNQEDTNYSVVNVNGDVTLSGWAPVFVDQNSEKAYGVTVNLNGATLKAQKDTGGNDGVGLYVNGSIKDTVNAPVIKLENTTIDAQGEGMYLAGYADTTIKGGSIVGTQTGIEIRAGKLAVNDVIVTGNGTPTTVTPNGNGSTADGVGIAVMQHTTKLPINVTISDSKVSGYNGVLQNNPQANSAEDIAKVTINIESGYFSAINGGVNAVASENNCLSITGGYFTSDPSAYVAEGKATLTGTDGYRFMVGNKVTTDVVPTTTTPKTDVSNTIPNEQKEAVQNAAASVKDNGELAAAANTVAKEVTTTAAEGQQLLNNASITATAENTKIYVQTYLDIKADNVEVGTNGKITSITLDITPMSRVVASTADNAEGIVLDETTSTSKNAVILPGSEKDLTNIQTMVISFELPENFVSPVDGSYPSVYVQHKGHEYTATVTKDTNDKLIAIFTNPDGFSPFTISKTSTSVATIGDNRYTTLQAAIDAVQNNETITLLKATNENVTVSKAIKFTLAGKDQLQGSIAAGSRYSMTTSETTSGKTEYTFTYVGGGSSSSISAPTTYAVNVNAATNGAVAADKKTASKGTTVTVTASPSKGYVVDAVKVVDKDGKDVAVTEKDGKYVFTMPASAVTVTGSFKAETPAPVALPFTDVKSGNWFYDAVKYAYEQGLMTGTSATTFAPNGTMNRAMIVTVLYRLEKSPAVTGASKFTDVPAGQWYSDAVAWAAANKIVNGYDETTFGPMNAVTREQMAAILFRYEQVKGLENVTLEENLNRFPDQNKISAYAIPALQWAVGQKIINGNADGTLDPTGTATRAQVAQIFTNLLNK